MNGEIESKLQDYYNRNRPNGIKEVAIKNATALNTGWESIIYAFNLVPIPEGDRQPERLILRIYPGENAHHKAVREYEGMQRLLAADYPVPVVYFLEKDNSPFRKPFLIMEYIEGEIMWSILDRTTPDHAAHLLTRFCEQFVQLHALDWHAFVPRQDQLLAENPYHFIDRYIDQLKHIGKIYPSLAFFLPVIDWLETRRGEVPCQRPAPVHWDFHPGNLIVQPDGGIKVIDWTQIQVTDPRFDLGWTLLLTGAYSGVDMRNFILKEYQRLSGEVVENLGFFDVANAIKRIASVMVSISAGAEKMGMRPDATANMRRDFPALRWVYQLMVERTEIIIPEIEEFLEL